MAEAFKVDRLDLRILAQLQKNGRMTNVDLADAVGLSPSPCWKRIKEMEAAGVIRGYTAVIDPAKVGLGLRVIVEAHLGQHSEQNVRQFEKTVAASAPIVHCYSTTGESDYVMDVLMPDIKYKINDPGMSAVWCILPALQAAIATGVVDKDKVALHGHSWGGYQTAFMVTQTDAFRAAIAGAPLTDMISMYNLIYWNTGGGNMAIFENSQGRFTSSPVDNAEAYIRNSPVFHAKSVKTPLMILHNDKDGAVDFTQGIEYFNQLRRLQKPVVMLQYKGENHGLRVPANMKDYTVRMREFLDHHLMGKPAPQWLIDGVPFMQIKDHLDERAKDKEPVVGPLDEVVKK